MRRIIIFCGIALLSAGLPVIADSWGSPEAFEVYSFSSNYIARVTPGSVQGNAKLEVFSLRRKRRRPFWNIDLSNRTRPIDVFISDDGKNVITFDNWYGIGYGDDVVAIYNNNGLLKKYSLESLFAHRSRDEIMKDIKLASDAGYYGKVDELRTEMDYFRRRFPRTISSREWRIYSFGFFDETEPVHALWIDWDSRWIAWDMLTGELIDGAKEQEDRWSQRYRAIILERISDGTAGIPDYMFLARLKIASDRYFIERKLSYPTFTTGTVQSSRSVSFVSESTMRTTADAILELFDRPNSPDEPNRTIGINSFFRERLTYLGHLKIRLTLLHPPNIGEGNIIIYLLPTPEDSTDSTVIPEHYLFANLYIFDGNTAIISFGETISFEIKGITPGEYTVYAIWDRVAPFESEPPPFTARKGDLVPGNPSMITIEPGRVHHLNLECMFTVQ